MPLDVLGRTRATMPGTTGLLGPSAFVLGELAATSSLSCAFVLRAPFSSPSGVVQG